jgi:hypothetical protein
MKIQISTKIVQDKIQDKIQLCAPYCGMNNRLYRSHGGKFLENKWQFTKSKSVDDLIKKLFGDSSELVVVQISAEDKRIVGYGDELTFGGYKLASRKNRDLDVEMSEGVWLEEGSFKSSGGTSKYPAIGSIEGIVLNLIVRADFAADNQLEVIKKISIETNEPQNLIDEKEKLLKRIAEIESQLSNPKIIDDAPLS